MIYFGEAPANPNVYNIINNTLIVCFPMSNFTFYA